MNVKVSILPCNMSLCVNGVRLWNSISDHLKTTNNITDECSYIIREIYGCAYLHLIINILNYAIVVTTICGNMYLSYTLNASNT